MASDREQLLAARDLIKARRFGEARALLKQVADHPVAQEWLAKLDQVDPPMDFPIPVQAAPPHVSGGGVYAAAPPLAGPRFGPRTPRGVMLWGAAVGASIVIAVWLVIVAAVLIMALNKDDGNTAGNTTRDVSASVDTDGQRPGNGDEGAVNISAIDAGIAHMAAEIWNDLDPITADNAHRLEWLLEAERSLFDLVWGDQSLYVLAYPGVYAYRADDVREPPDLVRFDPNEIIRIVSANGRYGIGMPLQALYDDEPAYLSVWDMRAGERTAQMDLTPYNASNGVNVTISADGHYVAATLNGEDEADTLVIWDAQTGGVLHTITDFNVGGGNDDGWIEGVVFSPSGRYVVVEFDDHDRALVWDVQSGALVANVDIDYVERLLFGPGDSWLLGMDDDDLTVWSLPDGREIVSYEEDEAYIMDVVITPDGAAVMIAGAAGQNGLYGVTRWDVATGLMTPFVTNKVVFQIAFSPDGTQLAGLLYSGEVMVWDAATGAVLQDTHGTLGDSFALLAWPVFVPDGFGVGTLEYDLAGLNAYDDDDGNERVRVAARDLLTGQEYARFAPGALDDDDYVLNRAQVSGDGRMLAIRIGNSIQVWDVTQGRMVASLLAGDVEMMALNYDGQLLAAVDYDGVVSVWNVAQQSRIASLQGEEGYRYDDESIIVFSRDQRWLVVSQDYDDLVDLWDLTTGQLYRTRWGDAEPFLTAYDMNDTYSQIEALALSPDGRFLAIGRDDWPVIELWDVTTGGLHAVFEVAVPEDEEADSLVFSANGQLLAVAFDGYLEVWNVATGTRVKEVWGLFEFVAFSPDDRFLVTSLRGVTAVLEVYGVRND